MTVFFVMNLFVAVVTEALLFIRSHEDRQTHDKDLAQHLSHRLATLLRYRKNKSLPHHKVIGTRALLALKW